MNNRLPLHILSAATVLLFAATACTQDDLGGSTLPEGEYPLVINATGLQAVATPASTRATVDGNWQGVQTVALSVGGTVKEYDVTASDTDGYRSATLSSDTDPFWWTSREDITVSAWWPYGTTMLRRQRLHLRRSPDRAVRQPHLEVQPPHGAGDNQPEARHRHHERGWCHCEPDEPVSR